MKTLFSQNYTLLSIIKYCNKLIIFFVFIVLVLSALTINTKACSTFFLKNGNHYVVGRNLDYYYADYMVTI